MSARAFTLVELIVVITILAILATVGFLSLQGYTKDARNSTTRANLQTISTTLSNAAAEETLPFTSYATGTGNNLDNFGSGSRTVFSGSTLSSLAALGLYRAERVDFAKLRVNPDKFNDDGKAYLFGAVTVSETDPRTGIARPRSAFQLAATVYEGTADRAYVQGNYAKTAGINDSDGLIWGTGGTTPGTIITGGTALPYAH
jgi:prepilin-type N-terminal cleavage/methylation domain-containing protein